MYLVFLDDIETIETYHYCLVDEVLFFHGSSRFILHPISSPII